MRHYILLGLLVSLLPISVSANLKTNTRTNFESIDFDSVALKLDQIIDKTGVQTAGIAIVKSGQVAWSQVYGELAPGVKASSSTLFNVASVTKVIVAETLLSLVEEGNVILDEKMSEHWVDPDIEHDHRHTLLTPQIVLNHTTGFSNWRFNEDDGQLKFNATPGMTFGYSGEGMDYLVKFVENKLDIDFESVVKSTVFKDASITNAAMSPNQKYFANIAQALTEDKKFLGHYCRPNGWCQSEGVISGADDLVISVDDLAKFLAFVATKQKLGGAISAARRKIAIDWLKNKELFMGIPPTLDGTEQKKRGYGLGWEVYDYGDWQVLGHGGSDWSEFAHVYFYSDTADGVIVTLNGQPEQNLRAMVAILEAIDPNSPVLADHQHSFNQMVEELNQANLLDSTLDSTDIKDLSDHELEQLILKVDTKLFNQGFNQCKFDVWDAHLSKDLEFYDDRSGFNNDRQKEVEQFMKKCNASTKLTRKLISSNVNRLNNFGAVQSGEHHFYEDDIYVGSGKFIHIWSLATGEWQVTRAISYDHK